MRLHWRAAPGIAVAAISGSLILSSAACAPREDTPAPSVDRLVAASTIVGGFVDQVDGRWGYEALRPEAWRPQSGPGQGRAFVSPAPRGSGGSIILLIHNLANETHAPSTDVEWELFRRSPTLSGWTSGLERSMASDQVTYTLLAQSSGGKVYVTSRAGKISLNAFVVDGGQPLAMALVASPQLSSLDPLDRLRESGLVNDFVKMAVSLRAIQVDGANVSPPLD